MTDPMTEAQKRAVHDLAVAIADEKVPEHWEASRKAAAITGIEHAIACFVDVQRSGGRAVLYDAEEED
jgi:HD superfamily phosphohydrolase YqeK